MWDFPLFLANGKKAWGTPRFSGNCKKSFQETVHAFSQYHAFLQIARKRDEIVRNEAIE
jgi:hypothetical protein